MKQHRRMSRRQHLSRLLVPCTLAWSAAAADVGEGALVPPAQPPSETLIVSGKKAGETDLRRQSTAGKIVVGREEISRYGDSGLGDVLKRLPGLSVSGSGRSLQVRMQGMGSAYTQILINGEPIARGFSLDTLTPSQIERIEILRAPTAEYSAQAMGGILNIVLREGSRKQTAELSLRGRYSEQDHYAQPQFNLQRSDQLDRLGYTVGALLRHYDQTEHDTWQQMQRYSAAGLQQQDELTLDRYSARGVLFNLMPRLNWRYGEGDSLSLQMLLSHNEDKGQGEVQRRSLLAGTAPDYDGSLGSVDWRWGRAQGTLIRQMPLLDGGKLSLRWMVGQGSSHEDNRRVFSGVLPPGTPMVVHERQHNRDVRLAHSGKWSLPLSEAEHKLELGYETEWKQRREHKTRLADGVDMDAGLGRELTASTWLLAAYGQDEWSVNEQWSIYAGLRWEQLVSRSRDAQASLDRRSRVLSPSLQTLWRLPQSKQDQLRFGVSRSYAVPDLGSLLTKPRRVDDNTELTPDLAGNAALKPALAWKFNAAYEHYLSKNGMLSAALNHQQIQDMVRQRTGREGERWVRRPYNLGRASLTGVELEAKFTLAELMEQAIPLDLQLAYSRYWSQVHDLPGPDNRLEDQESERLKLGMDYRLASLPLTLGGSYNWSPGQMVQLEAGTRRRKGRERSLDMYAAWRFSPQVQLRLTANQLGAGDARQTESRQTEAGRSEQHSVERNAAYWSATLELKY
ncbi:hypothetical protein GCM10007907_01820 [Chitinimonas prasina]|uniref:TonB-dependent receptor n=1 Tax=Chitinimonas prasina TaxID=1434937 RepID=A0ABQ5YAG2_9NEIS|nr:TonB-dependent receptor [Chitinimonas prasina]GLR11392.1 hypothetical protein GCM10007907_01820 [Chitinimonas prasina]